MASYAPWLTTVATTGTLLLEIAVVVIIALLVLAHYKNYRARQLLETTAHYVLPVLFGLTALSILITLWYSEVLGFIPCGLCWMERVFLYPQAALMAVALWRRDRTRIFEYLIALSLAGAAIALYHHYLQMGGTSVLPCPASGNADCGKRLIFEFGHITFPFMAFVIFAANTIFATIALRFRS